VIGGSLVLIGTEKNDSTYTWTGGSLALVGPFVEAIGSKVEKKYCEKNESK